MTDPIIWMSKQPVVLITGCGSGLGLSLAKELHFKNCYRVIATTRTELSAQSLREIIKERDNFKIEVLDITKSTNRNALIAKTLKNWKTVDILINNAGVSYRSVIEHMDEESEMHQLDVNYLSPLALIRLLVPIMRENRHGRIINISSVSGMVAMPTMASYSASKHALEGASEALWYELKPYGISVTLLQPGFIRSKSFEKIYFSEKAKLSMNFGGPYAEYYTHMGTFVKSLMIHSFSSPEKIAKKIIKIMERKNPPLWISVTIDASLFFIIRKILPRSLFHKFMFYLLPHINNWGEYQKKSHDPK